ncbi:MAG: Fic family protein [Desulfobacterales bacterium]|nr:Fic family protein [Desulfobacterales bacterium]
MSEKFNPQFTITPATANALMRIEAVKQVFTSLPITPQMIAHLRETARLFSTHYSTMIEGNRLTQEQVAKVIENGQYFPGRERDQAEVKGYYAALDEVERIAKRGGPITEIVIQKLHALVVGGGKTQLKPTPYRDGQNVIRDSRSQGIVYMPPEAKDVPGLMKQFVAWIVRKDDLPIPVRAGLAHYQFATIHPYYDGNGRTARLLTTLILHLNGYGLKGLYALEEYYARNLTAYYKALTVGSSHNYYMGRAEADVTKWIVYFIEGMAEAFEKVRDQAQREQRWGGKDQTMLLRTLDAKQRKVLPLFQNTQEIGAKDVAILFGYAPRTASLLCHKWVDAGFFEITSKSKKTRRYKLAKDYEAMISYLATI